MKFICLILIAVLAGCGGGQEDYYSDWTNHPFYLDQRAALQDYQGDCPVIYVGDSRIVGGEWDGCNFGISGDTTYGVLNRINDILALNPEVVVLHVGRNDLLAQGRGVQETYADYAKIFEALSCEVIITSTLPDSTRSLKVDQLNELLAMHDGFLDLRPELTVDGGLIHTYDGVHLDAVGYSIWYRKMEEVVL